MKIKTKNIKAWFLYLLIGLVVVGGLSFAAYGAGAASNCDSPQEGLEGGFLTYKGSLVPCGRQCDDPGTSDMDETKTCTLCHLLVMINRIFNLFLALLIIVALVLLTVAGVLYIVSGANASWRGNAKRIFTKTLTGFGLFLLSWLLVFTMLKFLSVDTGNFIQGDTWYEFQCDTDGAFQ